MKVRGRLSKTTPAPDCSPGELCSRFISHGGTAAPRGSFVAAVPSAGSCAPSSRLCAPPIVESSCHGHAVSIQPAANYTTAPARSSTAQRPGVPGSRDAGSGVLGSRCTCRSQVSPCQGPGVPGWRRDPVYRGHVMQGPGVSGLENAGTWYTRVREQRPSEHWGTGRRDSGWRDNPPSDPRGLLTPGPSENIPNFVERSLFVFLASLLCFPSIRRQTTKGCREKS